MPRPRTGGINYHAQFEQKLCNKRLVAYIDMDVNAFGLAKGLYTIVPLVMENVIVFNFILI